MTSFSDFLCFSDLNRFEENWSSILCLNWGLSETFLLIVLGHSFPTGRPCNKPVSLVQSQIHTVNMTHRD